MMIRALLLPLFALVLVLAACGESEGRVSANTATEVNAETGIAKVIPGRPEDALIGEYSATEGGQPEIRITKDEQTYFASLFLEGKWTPAEPLSHHMTEEDMSFAFGEHSGNVEAILASEGFFIAKLPRGTDLGGGMVLPDGYLAFLAIVPMPLYKL